MTFQTDFTEEVEAFLTATGMKPSSFGRKALGDPGFVRELRRGRSPGLNTAGHCREFMARHLGQQGGGE